MLAAKAPKAKHYSSSASLGYRVDSSILQKNEGYAYVSEVHASMGLSPGEETIKRSSKINMKRKKNKEKAKTKEAKRRRFFLKQTRTSKTASKEIREGKTYESEIGFKSEVTDKESEEIPEIQDITKIPLNEQEVIKAPVVIFDLETTGLSRKSDITQLAAYSETLNFSTYIFPSQAISKEASEVTQIFVNGNQMFHNSTAVQYKLAHEALTDFIIFLSSFPSKCILVGHNIKRFDTHVLYNQLHIHNMWNEFCLHVCAFCDTLDLFKSVVPGMSSYSQTSLVRELLGETYDAHNAIHDTKVLYKLVIERGNFKDNVVEFSLPVSYPYDSHVIQENLNTFSHAINCKAISKSCALKASKSNLKLSHLKLAVHRDGIDGLKALLAERSNKGSVRVTKCTRVIQKLFDFLHED
ncbi:uncharacterized protein LOC127700668 [Mytilus californianus]|uniref:uncharacterized protein LOC127700668 n=1 Tax=Mytilus californianus TaxID=6549 RepID=UPI002247F521|nr:uncharacterized protein LOC127700668 [Mytilus californianus]